MRVPRRRKIKVQTLKFLPTITVGAFMPKLLGRPSGARFDMWPVGQRTPRQATKPRRGVNRTAAAPLGGHRLGSVSLQSAARAIGPKEKDALVADRLPL
jgi:hypothetical protein